jgi:hypothetical protein
MHTHTYIHTNTYMQVLYNVLSHAVERCNAASPDTRPKIFVEAVVMRDEAHVCVRVQDNVPIKSRERVSAQAGMCIVMYACWSIFIYAHVHILFCISQICGALE